jgi:hypothetical protein
MPLLHDHEILQYCDSLATLALRVLALALTILASTTSLLIVILGSSIKEVRTGRGSVKWDTLRTGDQGHPDSRCQQRVRKVTG